MFATQGRPDDSRPIIFVKFLDRDTGEQIIRQPLAVGALPESNAVWSEMSAGNEVLQTLANGVRQVEQRLKEGEILASRYTDEPASDGHPHLQLNI